jgi:hypothetical protein
VIVQDDRECFFLSDRRSPISKLGIRGLEVSFVPRKVRIHTRFR